MIDWEYKGCFQLVTLAFDVFPRAGQSTNNQKMIDWEYKGCFQLVTLAFCVFPRAGQSMYNQKIVDWDYKGCFQLATLAFAKNEYIAAKLHSNTNWPRVFTMQIVLKVCAKKKLNLYLRRCSKIPSPTSLLGNGCANST
jgi:hypothetical protein